MYFLKGPKFSKGSEFEVTEVAEAEAFCEHINYVDDFLKIMLREMLLVPQFRAFCTFPDI